MDKRPNIILESFARPPYALPESRGITAFVDGVPTFEATFGDWHSLEKMALEIARLADPDARLIYTTEE